MYKSFDMIILTRSSKYRDYCVAGIDASSGQFVRLVTDNDKTHGALTYSELIMDNGCNASPLDMVHVEKAQYSPSVIQKENFRIKQGECLQYLRTVTVEEIVQYHPVSSRTGIFNHIQPVIQFVDAKALGHSLELAYVNNLVVYTESKKGRCRTKADFEINGQHYKRFSVTDPRFYGNDGAINAIKNALIVCSIADDEWAIDHGYYIFIAAIHPVFSGIDTDISSPDETQPRPQNAGKPWLPDDDERLLIMYRSGKSVTEIAEQFKRTRVAIQYRLVKYGIAQETKSVPEYYSGDN